MTKEIQWPDAPCKKCGFSDSWEVRRCINLGGHETYLFCCTECGERTQHFVFKKVAKAAQKKGLVIRDIPPAYNKKRPRCEVCGADGAERHHWAPYALFGSDADHWPQSFLCPSCHRRWHDVVTPTISAQRGLG